MTLSDSQRLHGLVAAPHTPFHPDGSLNLTVVEKQATHLLANGVAAVFIGGSTGECHSLTTDERRALAERWLAVTQGSALRVVVHVGGNCVEDARSLARHAEQHGAGAIGSLGPCYFKPADVDALISCAEAVASAAPSTPFYYYDIPMLTGMHHSMPEFLATAPGRIPNFAGIKFTNPDLVSYQSMLRIDGGKWDVPFGVDEHLLGALAMGAKGAVGSGFNFAAPVYVRLLRAFAAGDLDTARAEQFRGVQLIQLLSRYGYLPAAKAVMVMLGIDVGPARLPHRSLTIEKAENLRRDLETLGFFEWVR